MKVPTFAVLLLAVVTSQASPLDDFLSVNSIELGWLKRGLKAAGITDISNATLLIPFLENGFWVRDVDATLANLFRSLVLPGAIARVNELVGAGPFTVDNITLVFGEGEGNRTTVEFQGAMSSLPIELLPIAIPLGDSVGYVLQGAPGLNLEEVDPSAIDPNYCAATYGGDADCWDASSGSCQPKEICGQNLHSYCDNNHKCIHCVDGDYWLMAPMGTVFAKDNKVDTDCDDSCCIKCYQDPTCEGWQWTPGTVQHQCDMVSSFSWTPNTQCKDDRHLINPTYVWTSACP